MVPDEGGAFEQARDGSSAVYRALDVERGSAALLALLAEPKAALRGASLENAADVPSFESYFRRMLGYYESFRSRGAV